MKMSERDSFNPWVSIWTKPRSTIARLAKESPPTRGLWVLAAIYGFSGLLNFFQSMFLGHKLGLSPILLLAIVLGPLWGYASFSLWSLSVWFTGRWLKGEAGFKVIRLAYAWSCVPFIINVLLWGIMISVFGQILFMNFTEGYAFTQGEVAFLFGILIARIAVGIWSFIIYLNALAEVQQYSIYRAIGNALLAAIVMGVALWLVSLFFAVIFKI
jgi:hypothetical protein